MGRRTLAALAAVPLLAAGAVLASAATDQPHRSFRAAVVVEAPRAAIWSALTDFGRWTTSGRGLPR